MTMRELGPIAVVEIRRIEADLVAARNNDYEAALIGDFVDGEHPRLGQVKPQPSWHLLPAMRAGTAGVMFTGPVKQIVGHLQSEGIRVQVTGNGSAYRVLALVH